MSDAPDTGVPVEIPIFELPLAILPTERVPLHIFEERYKRMIAHCLSASEPFGIVLRTDEGTRSIGCTASVGRVVERSEDGRLNIIVEGGWRFTVLDRREGSEYPIARVRRLEEDPDPEADGDPARAAFAKLLEIAGAEGSPGPPEAGAYGTAARVELAIETKQELLETEGEQARLDLLTAALEGLAEQLANAQVIAERARSNGHGPVPDIEAG